MLGVRDELLRQGWVSVLGGNSLPGKTAPLLLNEVNERRDGRLRQLHSIGWGDDEIGVERNG